MPASNSLQTAPSLRHPSCLQAALLAGGQHWAINPANRCCDAHRFPYRRDTLAGFDF